MGLYFCSVWLGWVSDLPQRVEDVGDLRTELANPVLFFGREEFAMQKLQSFTLLSRARSADRGTQMGAQNSKARVTQALVFGSIYLLVPFGYQFLSLNGNRKMVSPGKWKGLTRAVRFLVKFDPCPNHSTIPAALAAVCFLCFGVAMGQNPVPPSERPNPR